MRNAVALESDDGPEWSLKILGYNLCTSVRIADCWCSADVEYDVSDRGDVFFMVIRDKERPNSELVAVPISDSKEQQVGISFLVNSHWTCLIRFFGQKMSSPRIELGTFRVLGECHNQLDHEDACRAAISDRSERVLHFFTF